MLSPGAPMTALTDLPYLRAYAPALQAQAHALLAQGQLGALLQRKYPEGHAVRSDKALYDYAQEFKARHLRNAGTVKVPGPRGRMPTANSDVAVERPLLRW